MNPVELRKIKEIEDLQQNQEDINVNHPLIKEINAHYQEQK